MGGQKQAAHSMSRRRKTALIGVSLVGAYAGWRMARRISAERRNRNIPNGQKIVILGAGFAGRNVAQELAKLLPRPEHGEITLVDAHDFLLFTPMLTEAAGGELETRHITSPIQHLHARITFEQGRVDEIDLKTKRVTITVGANGISVPEARRTLTADHLVIALGSVLNFHDIPGIAEHSLTIKRLEDAATIRNHSLALIERAGLETDATARRTLLTVVVGGGGFTGVETMAAVNDLLRVAAKDHPQINTNDIRTIIIDPGERLLPELNASLASYAQQKLEARGVEMKLKTKIVRAGVAYVELEGGERIQTQTFIWAGGIKPSPIVGKLPCQHGHHGGIRTASTCAVHGYTNVWALGDCAEIPQSDSKKTYAPTAQNATREGTCVASNIVASLRGDKPKPFTYHPIGELALVGKHSGVARIYGFHFSGLLAWALWRGIYLMKMPDAHQRIRILLDWLLDFATKRPLAELPSAHRNAQHTLHAKTDG